MNSIEKIVLFRNPTGEDFTGMWNSVSEVIKAGSSRHMELWRALHYAKHLIDRELNKRNVPTNFLEERKKLMDQIIVDEEVIEVPKSNVTAELANINAEPEVVEVPETPAEVEPTTINKKAGKAPKKAAKKETAPEEEFEGLNE